MEDVIVVVEIEVAAEIATDTEVVHTVIEDIIVVTEEVVIAAEVVIESMTARRKTLVPWIQVWKKK